MKQNQPLAPRSARASWFDAVGRRLALVTTVALAVAVSSFSAQAAEKQPNILVMWGDDIGVANVSAYSDGLMGYTTPNIDRLAKEGLRFLHYYAEQSCTAGRAAFSPASTASAAD